MELIDDELPSAVMNLAASKKVYTELYLMYLHVYQVFLSVSDKQF